MKLIFFQYFITTFFCLHLSTISYAQIETTYDSLRWYDDIMTYAKYAEHRHIAEGEISSIILHMLEHDPEFTLSIDSLLSTKVLTSPDKAFRIVTIQTIDAEKRGKFSGYVQLRGEKPIILQQGAKEMSVQEHRSLQPHQWLGAVYEKIIPFEVEGSKAYMLIGAAYLHERTWRHVIDVLAIENGQIQFGKGVFINGDDIQFRIVRDFMAGSGAFVRYLEESGEIVMDDFDIVVDPVTGITQNVPNGAYIRYSKEKRGWLKSKEIDRPSQRPVPKSHKPEDMKNKDIFGN